MATAWDDSAASLKSLQATNPHPGDGISLVQKLWLVACELTSQKLFPQAIKALQALCKLRDVEDYDQKVVVVQAHILLGELCTSLWLDNSSHHNQQQHRQIHGMDQTRLQYVESCLTFVAQMTQQTVILTPEWHMRFLKARYSLVKCIERDPFSRPILEMICQAVQFGVDHGVRDGVKAYRRFFQHQLETFMQQTFVQAYLSNQNTSALQLQFKHNLQFARQQLKKCTDHQLQVWLIEITCHSMVIASFVVPAETLKALEMADYYSKSILDASPTSSSSSSALLVGLNAKELRMYQLILSAFFLMRTGELKQLDGRLKEIKGLHETFAAQGTKYHDGILEEFYLQSILNDLELHVLASYDPHQAHAFSTEVIRQAQAAIHQYATNDESHKPRHQMLVAILFDMLFVHCQLQVDNCRLFALGSSLVQMIELFGIYQDQLRETALFTYYHAKMHLLIARYAMAIGRLQEAMDQLHFVQTQLLPPLPEPEQSAESVYLDIYLALWIELLEVVMTCQPAAALAPANQQHAPDCCLQMTQLSPHPCQLDFAKRIVTQRRLLTCLKQCSNHEVQAKFELCVAKWNWAKHEIKRTCGCNQPPGSFVGHDTNRSMSTMTEQIGLLESALTRTTAYVNGSNLTAEIMALLGPQLVAMGQNQEAESTLTDAVRISIHAKNVGLQIRLLVEVFRLYQSRQLRAAQETTLQKYLKKCAVLQKRIQEALQDGAQVHKVVTWRL